MIPFELKKGRITILGGTGSLGQALVPELQAKWPKAEITIVSRDEHKQAAMKRKFPTCKYFIGDIRDGSSIRDHLAGRDIVFHVAALKHVDIMEASPSESIKTNVLATETVAQEAIRGGVSHLIFSSTDKAVDPINIYGLSKAMSEKILFNQNSRQSITRFSVYRWGNVLGSNGSAIPFFADTLQTDGRAYITHPDMTRFWIRLEDAVRYILRTFHQASTTKAMVPPNIKAAPVSMVIEAIARLIDVRGYQLIETGMRPGEKIHEAMYSAHSIESLTSQTAQQMNIDELMDMLRPIVGERSRLAVA